MVYIQEGGCGVGESLRRASSERIPPDGNRSDITEDDWSRGSMDDSSELDGSNCVLNDLDLKVGGDFGQCSSCGWNIIIACLCQNRQIGIWKATLNTQLAPQPTTCG